MCVHFAFKGQWHHKALNNVQGFLFAVRRPYHPPSPPLVLRLPTRMRNVNEVYSIVLRIFFKLLPLSPFKQDLINSLHFPHSTFQYFLM